MMSPNLEIQQQHINNSLDGENLGLGPFFGCHSLCISDSRVGLISDWPTYDEAIVTQVSSLQLMQGHYPCRSLRHGLVGPHQTSWNNGKRKSKNNRSRKTVERSALIVHFCLFCEQVQNEQKYILAAAATPPPLILDLEGKNQLFSRYISLSRLQKFVFEGYVFNCLLCRGNGTADLATRLTKR